MTTESRTGYTDPGTAWQQQPAGAYPPLPGYAPPPGFQGMPMYSGAEVPGIGPVIGFTAVFGVFGAISASRRAAKARAVGVSGRKYWVSFGATIVASWALWGTVAVGTAIAGADPVPAGATQQAAPVAAVPAADRVDAEVPAGTDALNAAWLEKSIVADGDFRTPDGEVADVSTATCSAAQADAQGIGTYQCVIDFASGARQSNVVTVDSSGSWVTSS